VEYDEFPMQYIQNHANRCSSHTNYQSPTICEELLILMGSELMNEIISRIKLSKYYSVSLDSTANEGRVDQLTDLQIH